MSDERLEALALARLHRSMRELKKIVDISFGGRPTSTAGHCSVGNLVSGVVQHSISRAERSALSELVRDFAVTDALLEIKRVDGLDFSSLDCKFTDAMMSSHLYEHVF